MSKREPCTREGCTGSRNGMVVGCPTLAKFMPPNVAYALNVDALRVNGEQPVFGCPFLDA